MDGYKIIDFGGVAINSEPTIDGIFNEIDKSTKPLILTNMTISGETVTIKPYYANICTKIGTGATTWAYIVNAPFVVDGAQAFLLINDDDSITIYE